MKKEASKIESLQNCDYIIEFDLFQVECRNGDTTAGKIFETDVPQCSGQYCFKFVAPLPENDLAQMKNLVDRSSECVQQIEIKCLGAPLQVKPVQFICYHRNFWLKNSV